MKQHEELTVLQSAKNTIVNDVESEALAVCAKSKDQYQTIFSDKSVKEITDMITMGLEDQGSNVWADKSRMFVEALTTALVARSKENPAILLPSAHTYIHYTDWNNLQNLANKFSTLEAMQPLQTFIDTIKLETPTKDKQREVWDLITTPITNQLLHLETLKIKGSKADITAIQSIYEYRISHADISHCFLSQKNDLNLEQQKLHLVFKEFVKTNLNAVVTVLDMHHTSFVDCELTNSKIVDSAIICSKFSNTGFKGTVFAHSRFLEVEFEDIRHSESAVFVGCDFGSCDLTSLNAIFIDCTFKECEGKDDLQILDNK